MKTVIMAGGKGTRISSVASDIPKPMIKIAGKPNVPVTSILMYAVPILLIANCVNAGNHRLV